MKLNKFIVLFFVVVFSSRTNSATFSTVIYPEPDDDGKAVITLPEEVNATVTIQCIAFQDGGLRDTAWFIQPYGASQLESILNLPQFVRSGPQNHNLTIVNATSNLDRAEIWCGPSIDQAEPRFLLKIEGEQNKSFNACMILASQVNVRVVFSGHAQCFTSFIPPDCT